MDMYLKETPSIDYTNPIVQKKVLELKSQSIDDEDYVKRSYMFVCNEIPHSWDIGVDVVSKNASEALKNKTGICWAKSCLLAALLRANEIPSGISYQLLAISDDASEGHIIHALNTVYINGRWIRIDARGNSGPEQFSLNEDLLAFDVRSEMGEVDFKNNDSDLDARLVNILAECESLFEINLDFDSDFLGEKS